MSYIRTNIYLTDVQKRGLEQVALTQGLKTAELIRRILDSFLSTAKEGKR
jgi:hypothetical protein